MKYIGEIPARLGSKRVKQKNLRLICGKPMIAYAIEACAKCKKIEKVFVNTESDLIGKVGEKFGAVYYKRPLDLAGDEIVSDQFNYEFLKNIDCDALVMVNPVSPLVETIDIEKAIDEFEKNNYDSLISIKNERLQTFYDGHPLNFDKNKLLPMTQNLIPVQLCVWTVCIWKKSTFIDSYEKNGFAVFNGKIGLYPIDPLKAVKISYEEDFILAEVVLNSRINGTENKVPEYYSL